MCLLVCWFVVCWFVSFCGLSVQMFDFIIFSYVFSGVLVCWFVSFFGLLVQMFVITFVCITTVNRKTTKPQNRKTVKPLNQYITPSHQYNTTTSLT